MFRPSFFFCLLMMFSLLTIPFASKISYEMWSASTWCWFVGLVKKRRCWSSGLKWRITNRQCQELPENIRSQTKALATRLKSRCVTLSPDLVGVHAQQRLNPLPVPLRLEVNFGREHAGLGGEEELEGEEGRQGRSVGTNWTEKMHFKDFFMILKSFIMKLFLIFMFFFLKKNSSHFHFKDFDVIF